MDIDVQAFEVVRRIVNGACPVEDNLSIDLQHKLKKKLVLAHH